MKRHEKEFEQFLEDWKTHDKPWELWEFASHPLSLTKVDLDYWDWGNPNSGIWQQMTRSYIACFGLENYKFRRKPERNKHNEHNLKPNQDIVIRIRLERN